jgi:hypothetical protein
MTMTSHNRRPAVARLQREDGVALLIALVAMLLLTALGIAVTMTTLTETKISSNYRGGSESLYAADAAVERVMQDILTAPDWDQILNGTVTSSFVDGPPFGVKEIPGGRLDLNEATNIVRCGKTVCSDADMTAYTLDRPWGANNPRWTPYAWGPLSEMLPTGTINAATYVVVWIADDPAENDNDPLRDGGMRPNCQLPQCDPSVNPGRGVISMLAHAYGPGGVQRAIEVTLAQTNSIEIERGYTGQRGQDEQNRRARKAAVQSPGKALTNRSLNLASPAGFQ